MRSLSILIFTSGVAILGMELSAARLLEPVFGNSQIVWASLIGLILLYLAAGSWIGGLLADRYPNRRSLDLLVTLAAIGLALVPLISPTILQTGALRFESFAIGQLAGSLMAVLLLFSLPGILLGAVTPWAIRLALSDLAHSGQTAGRLYAIATVGSICGTFLPVLWLIPTFGTRWTFYLLALMLLLVVMLGSLTMRERWIPFVAFLIILVIAWQIGSNAPIRATWDDGESGTIIYEDESHYNYISVRQWGSERHLKLNDGVGIHSVYHPDTVLSLGIWDYFLLAPYFNLPLADYHTVENVLLIGLAAGTVSQLFTNLYGPIPITGVEVDPQIIEVGETYFGMNQQNLQPVAADGRWWLQKQPVDAKWDLIAIDAYLPPYIPFHLTTVEFFELTKVHLSDNGVLAINVGRTANNFLLVDRLAATLAEVFPSVFAIDEPGPDGDLGNSLLVATIQSTELGNFESNVAKLPAELPIEFREFAQSAVGQARTMERETNAIVLRDDRAPVEQIMHRIIADFLMGN